MSTTAARRLPWRVGEATHPGNTGKNNEDSYGYITIPVNDNASGQLTVAVVADGIGGEIGGEEAALLAVKTIKDCMVAHARAAGLPQALNQAIESANNAIYKRSRESELFVNMGTTAAIAAISDNRLYIANVGDSRIYLIRQGKITQLTTDHTWGQEAVVAGRMSMAEMKQHPNRNVIKRYLGISANVEVDQRIRTPGVLVDQHPMYVEAPLLLEPDDVLLLNTDGLSDLVPERDICSAVVNNPPQATADRLVEMARRRGGPDNITAVVFRADKGALAASTWRRNLMLGFAGALLITSAALVTANPWAAKPASSAVDSPAVAAMQAGDRSPTPESGMLASPADLPALPAALAATRVPEVSATPSPTSTPLPIKTPAPTSTPVPTATPTHTATPTQTATPTPLPTRAPPTATKTPSLLELAKSVPMPALLSPADGVRQRGEVTFAWEPRAVLPNGMAYELVWWNQGESPDAARGFAPPLVTTDVKVNLDFALVYQRNINWTVLIVSSEPYQRLTSAANGQVRSLIYEACQEHEVCKKCSETYIDSRTGETKTRTVDCDCKKACS